MVWNMNMIPYNAKKCQNKVKSSKTFSVKNWRSVFTHAHIISFISVISYDIVSDLKCNPLAILTDINNTFCIRIRHFQKQGLLVSGKKMR